MVEPLTPRPEGPASLVEYFPHSREKAGTFLPISGACGIMFDSLEIKVYNPARCRKIY
jgi:hypothetical protein